MGRSRYQFGDIDAPHFLTNSIVNWLPLFSSPTITQIVLDSFSYLQKEDNLQLHGYVIMENHIHWIARHDNLPKTVSRFKSFTARKIIDHLKQSGHPQLLNELSFGKKSHKTTSQYQVWQEGSHPQMIDGLDMLRQKLDYIHYNPVRPGYVDEAIHWRYSSARNYQGLPGLVEIDEVC